MSNAHIRATRKAAWEQVKAAKTIDAKRAAFAVYKACADAMFFDAFGRMPGQR